MKSRRTQIIFTLATIILVAGFVLVPHEAHAGIFSALGNTALTGMAKLFENGILAAVGPVVALILSIFIPMATVFVWLMGMFMDGALIMNLHIADIVNSVGAINSMWSIIRDSMSIIIIFVLLYASITMIIGLNEQKIKTLLVRVVLAGLLINFSLFFTKLIIDASNIIAIYIYNQIAVTPLTSGGTFSQWWNVLANGTGLSFTLMKGLYLQNTLVPTVQGLLTGDALANMTIGMIMSTIMMVLAGFSFLVAAIILMMRLFYLIMLMAFSPIWWIGLVLPQVSDYSKKWSKTLIGECMVAPIYMVFLYFAVMFMTSPALTGGTSSNTLVAAAQSASATTNILGFFNTGTLAVFFKFMIGIFLINASVIAAKSFGSSSGETGAKFYGWLKKATSDSMKKTASFAGRQTVGRAADYAQNQVARSDWAKNNPNAALMFNKAAGVVSSASFGDKKNKGGFVGEEKKRKEGQDRARKDLYERMEVNREDFPMDEAGEKRYEAEKKAEFERKEKFVENMKTESIFSHMMGDNPNARSHIKLEKDYKGEYGKEYSGEIREEMENNRKELVRIAELLNPENTLKRLGQDRSVETLKADQTRLESRNKDLGKFQDAAARRKEAAALKELAKSVNEMNKKDKPEEDSDSKKGKSKESSDDKDKKPS